MTLLPIYRLGQKAFNKYKDNLERDLFYSKVFNITNFHSTDIDLDFTKRLVSFQKDKKGIYIRPLTIKNWELGFDYNFEVFGYNFYNGQASYKFIDYVITWGLCIEGTEDRGVPRIKLYDIVVNEGNSYLNFGSMVHEKLLGYLGT